MLETTPLAIASLTVLIHIFIALAAPLLSSRQRVLLDVSLSISVFSSLLSAAAGAYVVSSGLTESVSLPIGLPDLPFYLRLDPLSGFFTTVVSLVSVFVSIYSFGYLRGFIGKRTLTPLVVFYSLFLAGMLLVLLSDDAYSFMISWELMAAASFFLVCFEDELPNSRRAAFVYLLVAHIGAVLILLSFGVLAGSSSGFETFNGYTFSAIRSSAIARPWASIAFCLAFFGFAAKAGMIPLHVWLPEAHPAAPSNVSALMSAVMLKVAVYGMVRLTFDLLGQPEWWWGGVVLFFGLISAVIGILYALVQVDLKRLLAYSSVENIGIILVGLGLAVIFPSFRMDLLAALSLVACLYHILNHAVFKSLLFMGAGSILHSTHERNMERLGGLIHRMPWTSAFFLVGCLSISSLPPFNGFVSEWLLFQSFLLSPVLPSNVLKLLIPLGAAVVALTAALGARCFVKVYGVTFLGHWRGPSGKEVHVHDAGWSMRAGMALAAVSCLLLGILPAYVIGWMDTIPEALTGTKLHESAGALGWMWLTPVAQERASYSPPIVFLGVSAVIALAYLLFHARRRAIRKGDIWDCGFPGLTERMQYNSTSFAMPLRRIFGFLFMIKETTRAVASPGRSPAYPERVIYHLKIRDRFWQLFYRPVAEASFWAARRATRLQHGKIQIYLLYSFITLIVLLFFA